MMTIFSKIDLIGLWQKQMISCNTTSTEVLTNAIGALLLLSILIVLFIYKDQKDYKEEEKEREIRRKKKQAEQKQELERKVAQKIPEQRVTQKIVIGESAEKKEKILTYIKITCIWILMILPLIFLVLMDKCKAE